MNENDIKRAADAAGKALGDASQAANREVQGWASAVPTLKKVLIGVAALIAIVFVAHWIG